MIGARRPGFFRRVSKIWRAAFRHPVESPQPVRPGSAGAIALVSEEGERVRRFALMQRRNGLLGLVLGEKTEHLGGIVGQRDELLEGAKAACLLDEDRVDR